MNIWVPRSKIIEPKRDLCVHSRVQGFFKIEAIDLRGRRRLVADWFPNLITNAGLNAIGTVTNWLNACKVGTGNATPDVSNTAMASYVAGTSTITSNTPAAQPSAPYYGSRTRVYRFAQGAAAGNLAEVGIGVATTNTGTLFSRALILDGGGSPTTITILSDEVLDVTYQIRLYPSLDDVPGVIELDGENYDYTIRAADVTNQNSWALSTLGARGGIPAIAGVGSIAQVYSGSIGAITGNPSGTQSNSTGSSDLAYVSDNYYRDFAFSWGLSAGNFGGGIGALATSFGTESSVGRMQIGFSPNIPKDNTMSLAFTFRHAWARGSI